MKLKSCGYWVRETVFCCPLSLQYIYILFPVFCWLATQSLFSPSLLFKNSREERTSFCLVQNLRGKYHLTCVTHHTSRWLAAFNSHCRKKRLLLGEPLDGNFFIHSGCWRISGSQRVRTQLVVHENLKPTVALFLFVPSKASNITSSWRTKCLHTHCCHHSKEWNITQLIFWPHYDQLQSTDAKIKLHSQGMYTLYMHTFSITYTRCLKIRLI